MVNEQSRSTHCSPSYANHTFLNSTAGVGVGGVATGASFFVSARLAFGCASPDANRLASGCASPDEDRLAFGCTSPCNCLSTLPSAGVGDVIDGCVSSRPK